MKNKENSIVVSFRTTTEDLAKALEGLLKTSNNPADYGSISNILRVTFFHGIISLCDNPTEPPSIEVIQKIDALITQNKKKKGAFK